MLLRPGAFVVLLILFQNVNSANILFLFGGGNYSHKLSIWPLALALSDKGHNVTFISSSPKQPKPSTKVVDLAPTFLAESMHKNYYYDKIKDREQGKITIFTNYDQSVLDLCRVLLNSKDDPAFTNILENGNFDLIIIDAIFGDCSFYIAHHLGSKYVIFDSTTVVPWFHGAFGLQLQTSWIPDFVSYVHYPMNFWDRLKVHFYATMTYQSSKKLEQGLLEIYKKRFGLSDAPTLTELNRNASLVLVNSHYSFDHARALPPQFVNIGGMQVWEPEGDLPKHFKKFMDSFEDGVILISFGSTLEVNELPEKYLKMFFNMMNKFNKVGFIWRWNGPLNPNNPNNLLSEKWLPQAQILREKSVRGFMSHCGMNGMLEATYNGIPIIAVPLFGDQDYHAYRIQAHEIGVRLEIVTMTQADLDGAVFEILNNPKYKENIMMRSELFRDRPSPVNTAVDAVEFVLRHDDLSPLKQMDLDQSYWVREHVDIYFFVFVVLAAINIVIPVTLIWICRKCFFFY